MVCTTLEVLAAGAGMPGEKVCALLDARKNQVFAGIFIIGPGYFIEEVSPGKALSIEELVLNTDEDVLFVGDGVIKYRDEINEKMGGKIKVAPAHHHHPRSGITALIGARLFREGVFTAPALVSPTYLRASDAEINYNLRMKDKGNSHGE